MLKRLLNEFVLDFELELEGRLIVKEPGEETERRSIGNDPQVAQPVATRLPDGSTTLYLPGSSLKGTMRAQAERIARSLNAHGAGSCDPFAVLKKDSPPAANTACSERILVRTRRQTEINQNNVLPDNVATGATAEDKANTEITTVDQYKDVCPICRTFGHIGWGRRLRITDFYPTKAGVQRVELTHIGVDRVSGGVASGRTFNVQYAYRGSLAGTLVLENFEMWQLGLIGFLWKDLADGLLRVGHKQTSGAGRVRPVLRRAVVSQFGPTKPADGGFYDVGALYTARAAYGMGTQQLKAQFIRWTQAPGALRWEASLSAGQMSAVWKALEKQTFELLQGHQWPPSMQPDHIAQLLAVTEENA